jgi:cell division septation protein DedD
MAAQTDRRAFLTQIGALAGQEKTAELVKTAERLPEGLHHT